MSHLIWIQWDVVSRNPLCPFQNVFFTIISCLKNIVLQFYEDIYPLMQNNWVTNDTGTLRDITILHLHYDKTLNILQIRNTVSIVFK